MKVLPEEAELTSDMTTTHSGQYLDQLSQLGSQLTIGGLVDELEARGSGLRVRIVLTSKLNPGLTGSGAWISAEDADWILVAKKLSTFMRAHVVLHEMAHLLLHDPEQKRLCSGTSDWGKYDRWFESPSEHSAEELATYLHSRLATEAFEAIDGDRKSDVSIRVNRLAEILSIQ